MAADDPEAPPARPVDPDMAITALRYLRYLLDGEEAFTAPAVAEAVVVGGEVVAVAGASLDAFVRALGLTAVNAMCASARLDGCPTFAEQLTYVRRLIDDSLEAHTLEALGG